MNKVAMIGNICRDIELRYTQSGVPALNFGIAVQRNFKNASGEYEADFIDCVAYRQTAEFIHKHFSKGNKIAVTGRLQTRTYTAQDGGKRKVAEVIVDEAEFVQARNTPAPTPAPQEMHEAETEDKQDLPF